MRELEPIKKRFVVRFLRIAALIIEVKQLKLFYMMRKKPSEQKSVTKSLLDGNSAAGICLGKWGYFNVGITFKF